MKRKYQIHNAILVSLVIIFSIIACCYYFYNQQKSYNDAIENTAANVVTAVNATQIVPETPPPVSVAAPAPQPAAPVNTVANAPNLPNEAAKPAPLAVESKDLPAAAPQETAAAKPAEVTAENAADKSNEKEQKGEVQLESLLNNMPEKFSLAPSDKKPETPNNPEVTKLDKAHEWLLAMERCRGISGKKSQQKIIALTFDDGPNGKYTEEILNILRRYRIKATFFLIGKNVTYYPGLVKKLYAAGNVLGNHTYSHFKLPSLNSETMLDEVNKTNAAIYKIVGAMPALFRPPYGMCSDISANVVEELGLKTIIWSDMANDYNVNQTTAEIIASDIIKSARAGRIIALHDGGGNRTKTVMALPTIIGRLQKAGYRFVTVPELLNIRGYSLVVIDKTNTADNDKAHDLIKSRLVDNVILKSLPSEAAGNITATASAAAHYLIAGDGVIYRLHPDNALLAGNATAIYVAVVNGQDEAPTEAQYAALVKLVKGLQVAHDKLQRVHGDETASAGALQSSSGNLWNFDWNKFKALLKNE